MRRIFHHALHDRDGLFDLAHRHLEELLRDLFEKHWDKITFGPLIQGAAWTTLAAQGKYLAAYGNIAGTGTALLPSLSISQITVAQDATNNNVTVTAAYPYKSLFGAAMPNFMGGSIATNFTLTIATSMRAL